MTPYAPRRAAGCLSLLPLLCGPLQAQEADDAPRMLEEVIVTAVPRETTVFESSISVSTLDNEQIDKFAARSTAEIFRNLPGIRSESSGGAGNANITVRGIPLATGGSKFMQLHEDGLPVLEFGDIVGGNTDNFLRYDNTVARVESIRGGSASTFASNSPGGVINLISKTGDVQGGSLAYTTGLDYRSNRLDFEYGSPLSDDLRFHVGGYLSSGEGPRDVDFSGEKGFQLKTNLTYEFDSGYVRFYGKHLDDTAISQLASAVRFDGGGSFSEVGGYDAANDGIQSPFNSRYVTLGVDGAPLSLSFNDSMEARSSALGVETRVDLDRGFALDYKARLSTTDGRVIVPLAVGLTDDASTLVDDIADPASSVRIASGPGAGQDYAGLAQLSLWLDFINDSLDYRVQDLKLSQTVGALSWTAGLYNSNQSIEQSWPNWVIQWTTLGGGAARPLEIVNAGDDVTDNGIITYNVFSTKIDLEYDTLAYYLDLHFDFDDLSINISARNDDTEGRGGRLVSPGSSVVDINGDGVISTAESGGALGASTVPQLVDFDASYTSFSLGGNYRVTDNLGVFARYSEGGRVVADRIFDVGIVDGATGEVAEEPVDDVEQLEIGVRWQNERFDIAATFFDTTTEETQFEITSMRAFSREYEASGIELEGNLAFGNFFLNGNFTWTDAEIVSDNVDPTVVGNTPRRQADQIFSLTPEFRFERVAVGLNVLGSTDFYVADSNELEQEGFVLINAFANVSFSEHLAVALNVNNLTDEFAITESEDATAVTGGLVRARPVPGRSTSLTLSYRF